MSQAVPLLKQFIEALQCLPGVGKKSAQRMAYHLLDKDRAGAMKLAKIIEHAMQEIGHCEQCRDYSEDPLCHICLNEKRDKSLLCVVETPADISAIESVASYNGKYFVLLGHLSPIDGIGPAELGLPQLQKQLEEGEVREVIVATSATVEGETTAHLIAQMVKDLPGDTAISRLAQGVPMGGELEYLDQSTLALSLANRRQL